MFVHPTRRAVLGRAAVGVGALVASAVAPERVRARATDTYPTYNNCARFYASPICWGGDRSDCNVQHGPPATSVSQVTVYSPDTSHELTCVAYCPDGPSRCTPEWFQARGAVTNKGTCSCTWLAA